MEPIKKKCINCNYQNVPEIDYLTCKYCSPFCENIYCNEKVQDGTLYCKICNDLHETQTHALMDTFFPDGIDQNYINDPDKMNEIREFVNKCINCNFVNPEKKANGLCTNCAPNCSNEGCVNKAFVGKLCVSCHKGKQKLKNCKNCGNNAVYLCNGYCDKCAPKCKNNNCDNRAYFYDLCQKCNIVNNKHASKHTNKHTNVFGDFCNKLNVKK